MWLGDALAIWSCLNRGRLCGSLPCRFCHIVCMVLAEIEQLGFVLRKGLLSKIADAMRWGEDGKTQAVNSIFASLFAGIALTGSCLSLGKMQQWWAQGRYSPKLYIYIYSKISRSKQIKIEPQVWSKQYLPKEGNCCGSGDFLACWLCPRFIFFGIRMDVETHPATRMKWIGSRFTVNHLIQLLWCFKQSQIIGCAFHVQGIFRRYLAGLCYRFQCQLLWNLVPYCHRKVPGDSAQ